MYLIYLVLIIAILVPGGAWASMDLKYGQFRVLEIRKLLINMIYCNFVIIACIILTYHIIGRENSYFDFINDIKGFDRSELVDEISLSVLYAIILTIFWLYVSKNDWITWFLTKIRATNRKGEGGNWKQTIDTAITKFKYCRYFDLKNKLIYQGKMKSYSYTEDFREVALVDVKVYDSSWKLQSKAPYIYLSFPKDQVRLEFFNIGEIQNA